MKKHLIVSILLLLVCHQSFGQGQQQQQKEDVPNFTPPTPEAFAFTKYGDVPVNESTGNANVNIPLYTYTAGSLSLPISLSHSGGAVKVNDVSTWTGISWLLNAGGVITRQVNDKPDEKMTTTRLFYTSSQLAGSSSENSPLLFSLLNGVIDSEVDIFNFSFGAYSGSFFLDENRIPRLTKYDQELKITLHGNDEFRIISITTPDGTTYSFGGENASEFTRMRFGKSDSSEYAQTTFYLYKIENFKGDIINISYSRYGSTGEIIGYNEVLTLNETVEPNDAVCPPKRGEQFYQRREYHLENLGKKIINQITSNRNDAKIIFRASQVQGENRNWLKLNEIIVYKSANEVLKTFALDYLDTFNNQQKIKRYFLEKVRVKGANNTPSDETYTFEYNNPELLPERFDFAQDYAGYYNGKTNTRLIPKDAHVAFNVVPQNTLADRSVNFTTAAYGSLKKVIYPTKGITEFEYETGKDDTTQQEYKDDYINIYHKDPARNFTSLYTSSFDTSAGVDSSNARTGAGLNLNFPIKVTVSAVVRGFVVRGNEFFFKLKNLTNNQVVETKRIDIANGAGGDKNYTREYTFSNLNPNHRYSFILEYYQLSPRAYPDFMQATAKISSVSNSQLKLKPGIRIKRIKNYASTFAVPQITRYYYNKAALKEQEDKDSELYVTKPRFFGRGILVGSCLEPTNLTHSLEMMIPYKVFQLKLFSDSQNNLFISSNNSSKYEYVTVSYGGDNFENGGKQSRFVIIPDSPGGTLSLQLSDDYIAVSKKDNQSLRNGTLLQEIVFNATASFHKSGEILTGKLKETENTYITLPEKAKSMTNCFVTKIHEIPVLTLMNLTNYVGNHYFSYYSTHSFWYNRSKTVTKEYFPTGTIQTTTEYFYDAYLAGLPSRIITKVNEDVFETRNTYVTSAPLFPYRNDLGSDFRIGTPVEIRNFKNNQHINTKITTYGKNNLNASASLVMPVAIKTYTGETASLAEDKVKLHLYDEKGNLLEFSTNDGMHTVYIWGYNNSLPIAKIENATYASLPAGTIANLQNLSNTSNETQLIEALQALRNSLPNAMVTTFIHNPLVGVKRITDPKGDTQTYTYDAFGRLESVKDNDGNLVAKNENHFKF